MRSTPFRTATDNGLDVYAAPDWIGDRPCMKITVRNPSDRQVEGWNVMVDAPGSLAGIVDARCCAVAAGSYHVTGEGRTRVIPPKGAVSFDLLFA